MSTEILVEATGLGKSYPRVFRRSDRLRALLRLLWGHRTVDAEPVLRDVDLVVCRGQSLGLIGENGAGKSTLLKCLVGLLKPNAGRISLTGRLGYCPQEPSLIETLTAREHLDLFGAGVSKLANGQYRFTPDANFFGNVVLTYTMTNEVKYIEPKRREY